MTSVLSMASLTGGLGGRNSISTNTVSPLIREQLDRRRILSVISDKVVLKNMDTTIKRDNLRRAEYQESKILERDSKSACNDIEDLFPSHIQEKLNHLPRQTRSVIITEVKLLDVARVMENLDEMVKDFSSVPSTNKAWRLGRCQRMTREEAKTSSQAIEKDYRCIKIYPKV
ncbi:hypothetical protein Tco_0937326 [Tanacetum coccineum]|uniref:Uncharacterized protein n=1 Tax=Tanacetum coccineum TaxID=301880 RepID=A0ABQ5DDZ9_9ASTR